jgi:BirA family biotin operon repressor/biotin-[acetyl-CoA-carboxylase] ligase
MLAGHEVLHLVETGSTSDEARRRAASGELLPGAVIVADRQTAGHGRHGRPWVTLPGRALAASVLLAHPPLPRLSRLSVLGAVAASRALQRLGVADVRIKWPNDLMRGERKLGGMLVETVEAPSGTRLLVFGVGINLALRQGDLPPGLRDLVTDAGLAPEARAPLLEALLSELDSALAELGTQADAERGMEYCSRAWLPGRRVSLRAGGEVLQTCIRAMTADGDLLLDDGRLLPGESTQLLQVERAPPR